MSTMFRYALPLTLLVFATLDGHAQSSISTFAGPDYPKIGSAAIEQSIDTPYAITTDTIGGYYISSFSQNRVYHVSLAGMIDGLVGSSFGFSGDGGAATAARFRGAFGVAVDPAGNVYIADTNNHRIRRVSPAGIIVTIAGNGTPGFSGEGGIATAAQLQFPAALASDRFGNIYIADRGNNRVRVLMTDGRIFTVAGTGAAGSAGDGGLATAAQLNQPLGVAVDRQGNVLVSEFAGHRIRKITGTMISTLVGTGTPGFSGDGGIGTMAQLNRPAGLAVDSLNTLYVADSGNHRVRSLSISTSVIGLVAGDGRQGFFGDMGSAFLAQLDTPLGVTVDGQDNVLIADTGNNRIRLVTANTIVSIFGNGTRGFSGDNGAATLAQFNAPQGVAIDAAGRVFIADSENNRIRQITGQGLITTFAGTGFQDSSGDGFPAANATLNRPYGVAADAAGNIFIAETFGHRIRKVDTSGIITTFAGIYRTAGFGGDGDLAIYAIFNQPRALAVDKEGNVFVADSLNNRIRQIGLDGKTKTLAGTGVAGFGGDGGPSYLAILNNPSGLALDNSGNLYIADTGNGRIRKIDRNGNIFTVAGSSGSGGSGNGDGLAATASTAVLSRPTGVAVDAAGNIFISERDTGRIRSVTTDGIIRTAIGNGVPGYSGDGGSATDAQINGAEGLAVDISGSLIVAEAGNHRIRKIIAPAPTIDGRQFTISSRGGLSLSTSSLAAERIVGYGRIQSTDPALGGLAIFSYRQNNVLISEAAVPATRAISAGRIYAFIGNETVGGRTATFVNTGLAIANPNDSPAQISFTFTGSANFTGSTSIPARSQFAAFVDQSPFNAGSSFDGTLTFNSSLPVAVTALRGLSNQRGEFLVTTLPVAELVPATGPTYIPHFADGGGWVTQIALINQTDSVIEGTVQFFDQSGALLTMTANGVMDTSFRYNLGARQSFRLTTSGLSQGIRAGSVRVTPTASTSSPTGVAIFSFAQEGITVTEAGVGSMKSGTSFRMYAEAAGSFATGAIGSMQSGIAITNLTGSPANVTLTLDRLDGSSTGLSASLAVPANGQIATFLNQIPGFASLPLPFQGVLRATSGSLVAIVGLRGRYNERSEFLTTTTAAIDEGALPPYAELFFPHIVDSGGYTTQFIILAGSGGQATGSLRLVSQAGQTLPLTLH